MVLALLTALALLEPPGVVEDGAPSPPDDVDADDGAEQGEVPGPPILPEPPTLPEPPVGPARGPVDSVVWTAPPGCPSVDTLRRGIERRLGRRLAPDDIDVDARVSEAEAGGLRLDLRTVVDGVEDERTLEANDCGALTDATALIVALAVDPVAVAEVLEASRAEAPADDLAVGSESPPRAVEGAPGPAVEPEAPPAPVPGGLGGLLRGTAGVGVGALPGVTGAFSLGGGLHWPHARVELEGSYWIPRTSAAHDGADVRVQLGTAGVRGCGQIRRDRIEAPLCGGLLVGGMRGKGSGIPGARTAQGLWLAVELAVGMSWWFRPRWALAGGFSAAVPVVQPSFTLATDPVTTLFEPPAVAARLWLGMELRLGRLPRS